MSSKHKRRYPTKSSGKGNPEGSTSTKRRYSDVQHEGIREGGKTSNIFSDHLTF